MVSGTDCDRRSKVSFIVIPSEVDACTVYSMNLLTFMKTNVFE